MFMTGLAALVASPLWESVVFGVLPVVGLEPVYDTVLVGGTYGSLRVRDNEDRRLRGCEVESIEDSDCLSHEVVA
jgi:hypothetical protein